MGNLSIGRSLIIRQLLYNGVLVTLRVVACLGSRQMALADGDVDIEIDGTERKDEIGSISRALRVLRDRVKKNNVLVADIHARDDREKRLMREAAVSPKAEKFSLNATIEAALTSQNAELLMSLAGELDTLAVHVLSDVRAFGAALREAARRDFILGIFI